MMGSEGRCIDDVATGGQQEQRLRIGGRLRQAETVLYVLMEEPGPPVLMHWFKPKDKRGYLVPHYKRQCPNCEPCGDEPKPLWYLGALESNRVPVILELTEPCFRSAEAFAKTVGVEDGFDLFGDPIGELGRFSGLVVKISRADFQYSQRVLRCEQRCQLSGAWPYRTRDELARIWRIPTRPRLYKA